MAGPIDVGMDRAELKKLLNQAKGGPVNCAIGLGKDNTALIMMHKIKAPKAVEKDLSGKFGDMKMSRWGTVSITEDGVARFTVNKAISGMARRLSKSIKGTGFTACEIVLEDGSLVEAGADEDEAEAQAAAGQSDGAQAQAEAGEADTESTTQPEYDVAAQEKELRELIGKLGKADPAVAAVVKPMAGEAVAAIKAKDGKAAEAALAKMREAMDGSGPAPAREAPAVPVNFVAMQKSRLIWDGARKKVAGEIASLKKDVMDLFEGDPEETQVLDALDQLDEITSRLDDRLVDALDDLLSEQDPAKHAVLLKEAKDVLEDYAGFVNSNPLVKQLSGDTPFGTKLTIGPTYETVIKTLQSSLR